MYLAHYELKSVMIMMMIIIIIIITIIVVVNIILVITRATIVTFLGKLLHRPASHSPVMAPVSLGPMSGAGVITPLPQATCAMQSKHPVTSAGVCPRVCPCDGCICYTCH